MTLTGEQLRDLTDDDLSLLTEACIAEMSTRLTEYAEGAKQAEGEVEDCPTCGRPVISVVTGVHSIELSLFDAEKLGEGQTYIDLIGQHDPQELIGYHAAVDSEWFHNLAATTGFSAPALQVYTEKEMEELKERLSEIPEWQMVDNPTITRIWMLPKR